MYSILCIVLVIKLIWGAYVQAEYMSILLKDLAVIRSYAQTLRKISAFTILGSITPILLRV